MRPGMWSQSQSSQSPRRCSLSIKLSMLLPVQWTALRRFVWTVLAPARSSAALRLSTVGSPGSEGLARLGELPWVSCTHGGRRHGQGWGHGDGPWLRPNQREHPGYQSGDHRVLQVSPVRCWCCCVCVSAARFWCVKLNVLVLKKTNKKKKNGLMFYFIMKIITLNILRNNKTLQKVELINKIDLLFEDTRTFQYVLWIFTSFGVFSLQLLVKKFSQLLIRIALMSKISPSYSTWSRRGLKIWQPLNF